MPAVTGDGWGDRTIWKRVVIYGALLAAGALALQWLDYQRMVRAHPDDFTLFLIALAFLALGLWIGARVIGPSWASALPPGPPLPGAYDFARVAWFQGIGATGKAMGPVSVTAPASPGVIRCITDAVASAGVSPA